MSVSSIECQVGIVENGKWTTCLFYAWEVYCTIFRLFERVYRILVVDFGTQQFEGALLAYTGCLQQ
jgi:hypothetical protein